jgi:SAM-dependent methyltransferase
VRRALRRLRAGRRKHDEELGYWRARRAAEGRLENEHYAAVFTGLVGLEPEFYAGAEILDVGCGPRGSLEWAHTARRRVGLDPLADAYRELGTDEHAMEYVQGPAERMPFDDASFDVVTSFNSLDHVDDLDRTVAEVKRVMRPGGHLVLAVEVGDAPTWTEPQTLSWESWRVFEPELELVARAEYERGEANLYDGAFRRVPFDHSDSSPRTGVLTLVMRKR